MLGVQPSRAFTGAIQTRRSLLRTPGSGRLITTAVGSAIITDDGRVAAGAVPEQVLTDALTP